METSPWWHTQLAFCTKSPTEKYSPKSVFCDLVIDFGLSFLIQLVLVRVLIAFFSSLLFFIGQVRDLAICAGMTLLAGDSKVCLAYYVSQLAWPGWMGDFDMPWIAHNVHL